MPAKLHGWYRVGLIIGGTAPAMLEPIYWFEGMTAFECARIHWPALHYTQVVIVPWTGPVAP